MHDCEEDREFYEGLSEEEHAEYTAKKGKGEES